MIRSIKEFYGDRLGGLDGDIGRVKDFYFDDRDWAVRYLVADTGSWLPGRKILISPHSLGAPAQTKKVLRVNLTQKQIENAPTLGEHNPVSRQYEEDYYRYFGWPYYWQGEGLWGVSSVPIVQLSENSLPPEPISRIDPPRDSSEAHLRSTQAVNGYHLQANDGTIGQVSDFMIDNEDWAIRELVITTDQHVSGKELLVPARKVDWISYPDSKVFVNKVFVNLTKKAVEQSPARHLMAGAGH